MASGIQLCTPTDDVLEKIRKLKFTKETTINAIICKINAETQEIIVEDEYMDTSIDELQSELNSTQPRYLIMSYKRTHSDGRISYPFIFIYSAPSGCKMELNLLYSASQPQFVEQIKATKKFDIRDTEELTEEWLNQKLELFK